MKINSDLSKNLVILVLFNTSATTIDYKAISCGRMKAEIELQYCYRIAGIHAVYWKVT
jgi:hypothetical protein